MTEFIREFKSQSKVPIPLDAKHNGSYIGPMNKLARDRRAQILGMMVEGNSIRAIVRMTGVSKNTVVRLLEDAGEAFSTYQDRAFRDLTCKRFQLDEIWAFCYAKQRNLPFARCVFRSNVITDSGGR